MDMKFKMPEGFEVPPDADEDGEFMVAAKLKDNGDGTITLLEIDGSDVDSADEERHESKDSEAEERKEFSPMGMGEGMYARARERGITK